MKIANNIIAMVCLINIQSSVCLPAIKPPELMDACISPLECQIFGRRIRVNNQSGIRFWLKICRSDGSQWESILENNASVDIGTINNIPKSVSYEPYGNIVGRVYLTQYGTILLDDINKLSYLPDNMVVIIKIKRSRMFGWGNDIKIELEPCRKNILLPNLFPSVQLYMTPGYMQGAYCSSIEEFKRKDCINLPRYILGLSRNFSANDVVIKANRLLEEWNLELYEGSEKDSVCSIISYIEWAKMMLLKFLELPMSTRMILAQMPAQDRNEVTRLVEENAQLREKLTSQDAKVPTPPPPPPMPPLLPGIPVDHAGLDQAVVCAGSPQAWMCSDQERLSVQQPQVVRPQLPRIKLSDLSEVGRTLRSTRGDDSGHALVRGGRGIQEISSERWNEITQNTELITHDEFILIKLKYESDEPDPAFLLNLKKLIEHVNGLGKLDKLLNVLDRSRSDVTTKQKVILGKISARLSRDALARDIVGFSKLKK
jgi:hypothetical protein